MYDADADKDDGAVDEDDNDGGFNLFCRYLSFY
jgi:hypothetical protein